MSLKLHLIYVFFSLQSHWPTMYHMWAVQSITYPWRGQGRGRKRKVGEGGERTGEAGGGRRGRKEGKGEREEEGREKGGGKSKRGGKQ